jgi:hypothetical protein
VFRKPKFPGIPPQNPTQNQHDVDDSNATHTRSKKNIGRFFDKRALLSSETTSPKPAVIRLNMDTRAESEQSK